MNKKILKFLNDNQLNSSEAIEYIYNLKALKLKHSTLDNQTIKTLLNMTGNLKSLYIDSPLFNQFPDDIQRLEQVEDFTLSRTTLPGQDFKKIFTLMPNLKKMNLYNFDLQDLPGDLPIQHQIQTLDFQLPQATSNAFKKMLAIMPNLTHLTITCDNFSPLPDDLVRLEHLEVLNLQRRPISGADFRKLMDIMPNVKFIYGLQLTSPIPDSVSRNNNLEMISISGTLISENFKQLAIMFPNIKKIHGYLQNLDLQEDPSQMERLEYLSMGTSTLDGTNFKRLADKTPNLKTLKIECRNIEQIPNNFPILKDLEELILLESTITGEIFKQLQAKLPKIKQLSLGDSLESSQIPDDIPNLKYVETLDIDITSLDDDNLKKLISMMPNLKKIAFVSPGEHRAIPGGFPSLANVEVIDLEETAITGDDLRRLLLKTDPRKLHEINLNNCHFTNMDLRMGEFALPNLKKLDLLNSNIDVNNLLVLVAATSESKLLEIDVDKHELIEMLHGISLWAKVILVGAFPHHLLEEFTTNEKYMNDYKTLLASKAIGNYEQQALFFANHHPNPTDSDYQHFAQNRESFEPVAAKYWKQFSGTIAMIPYKVVMAYINTEGALLELLNTKGFVVGNVEKIAAYNIFAKLYLQYTLDSLKKSHVDEVIESSRRGRDRLYQVAISINELLRQDESYEKLEQCQDIIELFQTLFRELFSLAGLKPSMPQSSAEQTNPRKKPNIRG